MPDICLNILNEIKEESPQIVSILGEVCKYDYYATDVKETDRKKANISYVNLGECENQLRIHYNIPPEEKIYIGQNKCYEYVDYKVFNSKNEELDLSICKDIKIKVSTPVDPSNPKVGILLALEMQEQGIDIYNKDEEVFNDVCTSLSLNGKDLSMEARQKDIYKDVSEFCNENCIPHVNLDSYEIECDCPTVKNENENEKNDDDINSFLEENEYISMISNILSSTNIHLFKCAKKIKSVNIKNLLSNKGFIICGGITISQFILSGIFLFTQINNIFSQVFRNFVASPIKIQNNKNTNNSNDEFIENTIIKQNSLKIYRDKLYKDEKDEPSSSKRMIEFEKKKIYQKKTTEVNEKLKEEFTNDELNELNNFEDVLELDKRSIFSYYISIFIEKQIFFSTIFKKSLFYPFSFRLLILFFTIQCFLFLNGLFFTQEYLNKRYRAKKLDFVYIIKNEITKSIYASVIVLLIGKILNIITTFTIDYLKITKNVNDKKYSIRLKNIIFEIKKKFYIIIVIIIVFSFIFWYFLFIFCDIFKNNQMSWILSTVISFVINIIIPFSICIIITILRFIALKIKSGIIFEISLMFFSIM